MRWGGEVDFFLDDDSGDKVHVWSPLFSVCSRRGLCRGSETSFVGQPLPYFFASFTTCGAVLLLLFLF